MNIDNGKFSEMSNVSRYQMLEQLSYGKKYKFDIRLSLNGTLQSNYVLINQNYACSSLLGLGLSFMFYNLVTLFNYEYYLYDIYSIGFYNYSFLSLNSFLGSRFIFYISDNRFKRLLSTSSIITEVFFGFERMKVYNAYDNTSNEEATSPCLLFIILLDYISKQVGFSLKIRSFNILHNMQFSYLVPGIVLRL